MKTALNYAPSNPCECLNPWDAEETTRTDLAIVPMTDLADDVEPVTSDMVLDVLDPEFFDACALLNARGRRNLSLISAVL